MSRVIDPRLLRYAEATRGFLCALVALGGIAAALIIAQAWLMAEVISSSLAASGAAHRGPVLGVALSLLALVVVARAMLAWAREVLADRASARAKSQLRKAMLAHVGALGPGRPDEPATGELAVLATRGIDALDAYFSRFLPQLLLAAIVPVAVVGAIATQDWISALIIAGTVPLIPLFMALVGAATRDRMEQQLSTLQQLAGHFLEVVAGLPTLKVFGRAKAQVRAIGEVTGRYRLATMSTLRVTFMSSLILELVATISVALVAVEIGLRLMGGDLGLRTGLIVLVLAPEAFLPLRQLGAEYHASAEGMGAARRVFAVLETPPAPRGRRTDVPDPAVSGIGVENLWVRFPGRGAPALEGVTFAVDPGEVLAVTGPSGCGKSTLLAVLLGFCPPQAGVVRVGDVDLAELDPDAWRAQLSWMPQRPHMFAASIAENIRVGRPEATIGQVAAASRAVGLTEVLAARPGGLETKLGERGAGLSVGERQRVALARALVRDAPVLLLDEPTANLDGVSEDQLLAALRELVQDRTVILVAHRPALLALADRVLELGRPPVPA